jgi:hypothetical protein
MFQRVSLVLTLLLAESLLVVAVAQQQFELVVPGRGVLSRAERSNRQLRIEDAAGMVTVYQRDPRFDSADGAFWGYTSREARQIIRWPRNDQGRMEIATDSPPAALVFRPSQMTIRAVGPALTAVTVAEIEPRTAYRLVPDGPGRPAQALASDPDGRLHLGDLADRDTSSGI